jgi:hypothetical protein
VFLQYQRVGLSHDISANSRHQNYAQTVASKLDKLEAQRKKKLDLRQRLNAAESEVSSRKKDFELGTRKLNEIFGNVLESVATVHTALAPAHGVLRHKYAEVSEIEMENSLC